MPAPASASAKPGYYKDDGPGDTPPANLDAIPDPVPRAEPLHRFANRPYSVFGREYVPATSLRPYKERGVASWYGRKFHGEKTSTGEVYDMYAMTAAHPTLPLPSYARVTNVATGKSVIVRVNDRGPFLHNRVIDLSYAAAHRVGIAQKGSGEVEVEAILPGTATMLAAAPLPPLAAPASRCDRAFAGRADSRFRAQQPDSPCRWAPSAVMRTRRISSNTCRTKWRRRKSKRRFGRWTACSRFMSGRTPTATRRVALRNDSRARSGSPPRWRRIESRRLADTTRSRHGVRYNCRTETPVDAA